MLETLYASAPICVQNLALSCYGGYLNHLRYGSVQRAHFQSLLKTQWATSSEIEEAQNRSLLSLMKHVFDHVPFYRELYAQYGIQLSDIQNTGDLGKLPIVTKEMVRGNVHRFMPDTMKKSDLVSLSTSGTTGTPLSLFFEKSAIQKNYAFFARALDWGGVQIGDRSATFAGRTIVSASQAGPPYWRVNAVQNNTLFSSYHLSRENFPFYVDKLNSLRPRFIDSYPSALYVLAQYIDERKEPCEVRPKAIFTSSETLLPHQREIIQRVFESTIYDQYGSAEMAAFICQCERGSYHVNPEFGIVEVLRDHRLIEEGSGELVCTGFLNYAVPLIRYKIGDSVTVSRKSCLCGRQFPVVDAIEGRTDDFIVTPEGKLVGRLDPIFKGMSSSIREAQIVQDASGQLTLKIVKSDAGASDLTSEINGLIKELRKRLGELINVRVEYLDAIPRERNGKFRSVISLLKSKAGSTASPVDSSPCQKE
jgi:phenylacetate-CoA ligase